jgi:poly(A) polymerase
MTKYLKNLEKFLKVWDKNPNLEFIKKLQKQFPKAKIYLVGGMVRDLALGRQSIDYDFVVAGVPKKRLELALAKMGKVDLVGKTFGVYKFKPRNFKQAEAIDIALPRTEHAFGTGGYRDVKVKSDWRLPIEKDLERRDFTINAMALKLQITNYKSQITNKFKIQNSKPVLIDPHGGLADLKKQKIRAVGKPEERFKEDYSRMLRAIRLACQLNFDIEPKTWKAIKKSIKNLNKKSVDNLDREIRPKNKTPKKNKSWVVPREVIAKELVKAMAENPARALELLDKSGAIKVLMPELLKMKKCPQPKIFHSEGDVWQHTILALQKLSSLKFKKEFPNQPISNEVIWGILFHDIAKPYTKTVTDRIRFNEHDIKGAKMFIKIAERLRLSSTGLNIEKVATIIKKHLLPTHSKVNAMKETTIEKYFFNEQFPGKDLLMLIYADILATIPPSGKPDFKSYKKLKKRILDLKKKAKIRRKQAELPPELLDGYEIMKVLKIKPGPKIGKIKEQLREAQLEGEIKTKKEAREFIKELKVK